MYKLFLTIQNGDVILYTYCRVCEVDNTKRRIWLRNLRIEKGLTQAEVGEALGLSFQEYSFLERYERYKKLPLGLAYKLADVLGITLDYIREAEEALSNELTSV